MKLSTWDKLSIIFAVLTLVSLLCIVFLFINPQSILNPFPYPTVSPTSIYPSPTVTPLRLPPTWTPTPLPMITLYPSSTPELTATPFRIR